VQFGGEARRHTGPKRKAFVSLAADLHDLLSQPSPVGRPDVAAGVGGGGKRHDLVDLAAGDFHFDGRVQEIGRVHGQLE